MYDNEGESHSFVFTGWGGGGADQPLTEPIITPLTKYFWMKG